MKLSVAQCCASIVVLYVSTMALALAGQPIGGIIVKGGKNPGGQMRALATTDADGRFRIQFTDGGDYTLEFDGMSNMEFVARVKQGVDVHYSVRSKASDVRGGDVATRHTPFHNKQPIARMIVNVPNGGGTVSGRLETRDPAGPEAATARAINEAGMAPLPKKTKGGLKF